MSRKPSKENTQAKSSNFHKVCLNSAAHSVGIYTKHNGFEWSLASRAPPGVYKEQKPELPNTI